VLAGGAGLARSVIGRDNSHASRDVTAPRLRVRSREIAGEEMKRIAV
jgi:hypothetical protein